MRRLLIIAALAAASFAPAAQAATPSSPSQGSCHVGVYRLADGSIVDIAPTDDDRLRWRLLDGAFGRLKPTADGGWTNTAGLTARPDPTAVAFKDCDSVSVDGQAGVRVPLTVTDTIFRSGKETLRGRLVLPKGDAAVPVVVMVHGSESTSAVDFNYRQRQYPATGVGVFVYDKRGTGRSTGLYSQDFHLLSDDAAAALTEARRLAGKRASRIGFEGGSQGGWVAPLAAVQAKVDFLEVGFGVVGTALEQDQWQVDYQLRQKGLADGDQAKVHEVTDATAEVMAEDFSPASLDRVEALRRQYGSEPWFARIEGQYSGELLKGQAKQAEWESPGVPWRYSSLEAVRRLNIPQLWVFAAEDSIAPSAPSIARLEQARGEGRRIDIAVFPRTDHGIRLFTEAGGERKYSGAMAPGYLKLIADFAKGDLAPPYGEETWPDAGRRAP